MKKHMKYGGKPPAPPTTPEPPHEEHPEDRALRIDGEAKAKREGPVWCERNRARLDALVLTYADRDAEEALAQLREEFWTSDDEVTP